MEEKLPLFLSNLFIIEVSSSKGKSLGATIILK